MVLSNISLVSQKPTEITPKSLKAQLDSIGLNCSDACEENLQGYIYDTRARMADGDVQTYSITRLKKGRNSGIHSSLEAGDYEESADGSWRVNNEYPYQKMLLNINHEKHFNYLLDYYPRYFRMRNDPPPRSGIEPTVIAIQEQFVACSYAAAAVVVNGISEKDMESVMSNAISPLTEDNAKDYDESDIRSLFLVYMYDDAKKEAECLGVLTITWHLRVSDYKEKSKDDIRHKWSLEVSAWAGLYPNAGLISGDDIYLFRQFG